MGAKSLSGHQEARIKRRVGNIYSMDRRLKPGTHTRKGVVQHRPIIASART